MKLETIITPETICTDLASAGKLDVLGELGELLARGSSRLSPAAVTRILVERERLATTGVGEGVAIPHGKSDVLTQIVASVGISRTGVPFDSIDGAPVHIFVALMAPQSSSGDHLRALARVSRLLKDPAVRERLMGARTPQDAFEIIIEEDEKHSH